MSSSKYPSGPVDGDRADLLDLVADDWRATDDWDAFKAACLAVSNATDGQVDPNLVRSRLTNEHGLTIEPRRYSAFWHRAAGKDGFLAVTGWTVNTDIKGGNNGKPTRLYRWKDDA